MPERRECFVKDPRTTITARKGEREREMLSTLSPLHDLFLARFQVARWEKSYAPACFLSSLATGCSLRLFFCVGPF